MHDWENVKHYQLRREGQFNGYLTWNILLLADEGYFGIAGPTLFIRIASEGRSYEGKCMPGAS